MDLSRLARFFYPKRLVQRRELEYAAAQLTSIEINGSFHSVQRPTSYASWRNQTPDDFVFSVKGGRHVTHLKRLRDVDTALACAHDEKVPEDRALTRAPAVSPRRGGHQRLRLRSAAR